ncbi:MAG: chromosome partitioning protein ParB [Candidatus Magasanikbacteria bacterium CG10_big_fil_rev_8_21_14_0_10_36_32]|uniref:Chromosome partitioning protein ParB n=1 Tax=Candidatus Magasanikbacteria bacterium CG10_big_fil_rev_8_21_14_0_10_36_32 TaxID=1974646 RepID=A0A2M6W6S1_9BACT|nr:MAG: chromosome partitioning protein ParB [Candidatus Magasanikbacteria bacterium CG10_big_fil_rev_8_21_14_0_10_36_32]
MSLGRGLGALISSTGKKEEIKKSEIINQEPVVSGQQKIWLIPITQITPNTKQPRRHFDPLELEKLSDSVKKYGILQPIILIEKPNGDYEVVAGERRWRAAKLAGLTNVPAIVKVLPDEEKLEIALIENIQREDLNPIEEAFAYRRLIDEFHLTQEQVSDKVGKSRPAVANIVRLLELPDEIQKALIEKQISMGQSRALLGLKNKSEQLDMLASMLGEKISVRELEHQIRKKVPSGSQRRDPNLMYLEEKLRQALGTKVSITQKGEKGVITINYFSKEELSRIIKKIDGGE